MFTQFQLPLNKKLNKTNLNAKLETKCFLLSMATTLATGYNTMQYNIYFAIYDIYRWKKQMKKIDDRE